MKKMFSVRYKYGRAKDAFYRAVILADSKEEAIERFADYYNIENKNAICAWEQLDGMYTF